MKQLVTSGFLTADMRDLLKGLVVAVLTSVFTVMMQSLEAGSLVFNWKAIAVTGLASALGYILKNMLTPSKVEVSGVDATSLQALKEGKATTEIVAK